MTYDPVPTATVYYPAAPLFAGFLPQPFARPMVMTAPRYVPQSTTQVTQPVLATDSRTRQTDDEQHHTTSSSSWEPVGLIR